MNGSDDKYIWGVLYDIGSLKFVINLLASVTNIVKSGSASSDSYACH